MGYYIKGEAGQYFAAHMKNCIKHPTNNKKMIIGCDSHVAAESIGKYVKSAISDIEWYDSGTELDKDVIFKFQHPSKRDYAVEQINKDVSSYQQQDPTSLLQEPAPTNTPAEGENAQPDEDEDKKKPDWTTYAIIGLAAVALILLVWPKRKK